MRTRVCKKTIPIHLINVLDVLKKSSLLFFAFFFSFILITEVNAQQVFTPEDLLKTKYVDDAKISPDGDWIAYTLRKPRKPNDKPGGAYYELYLVSVKTGNKLPFVTGKVHVSDVEWRPDGSALAFIMERGEKQKDQVWLIPLSGGEARQITNSETNVLTFKWHPSGDKIAYTATTPPTEREKALKDMGYDFIYFEEEWKHRNIYMIDVGKYEANGEAEQITEGWTVWSLKFSPDGNKIAAAMSEKNLVDYKYMFQKVYLIDLETKNITQITDNPGKLGNYAFSPDGTQLAYTAALERKDHAVSQVYVKPLNGGEEKNLTIPDFRGHVNWVGWKDKNTVVYRAGEGVWTTLSTVSASGGERNLIMHSKNTGVIFEDPSYTENFKHFALVGGTPEIPGEVYYWSPGNDLKQMTTSNPWLTDRKLGNQELVQYNARDGVKIEGLLIYPVDYQKNQTYPLVVIVHGGPESHYSNEWLSYYSRPGQILAGRGYVVFYPNYRGSTGYGVEYAMKWHYGQAAGTEFDDVADGIDYLIDEGIADKDRVGLGGGSYGGFAAAWFGTYYTEKVNAVCMFVGISDLISKRGTTDIPYEELYVHSGEKLEEMWNYSLKHSPIYYAHQSQSAFLIYGGTDDTRVSPSQSEEIYTRLKMNNHPAYRLVRYPGEGHGNREQPGRIDVLYRTLDWYDWYVKDAKPLDGPMPPLDISEKYGLELPE